jgi:GWxTD domain-containing protein
MILGTDRPSSVAILPFPGEKLPTGLHDLKITIGDMTVTHPLPVIWPDMPRSLMNPAYAFDALRFITTTDQLDSLNNGSEEERMKQFENFWTSKDRTPETMFNEVMTEYYTRVDYAAANFGTLRDPDGTWTDRGRIHVLYGTPTKIERNLDPSGFIEIWIYDNARKKFIFLDETKTGNYVLTSTRPL